MSSTHPPSGPRTGKKGCLGKGLIFGCLGITALVLIIGGLSVYWFLTTGKSLLAEGVRDSMVEQIEDSELSEQQKNSLITEIDRVTNGVKDGSIGIRKMVALAEELGESPFFEAVNAYTAASFYLSSPELSPEERKDGELTLHRVARGLFERKINRQDLQSLIGPVSYSSDHDEFQHIRDNLSMEELRELAKAAKDLADQAGVSNEYQEVDFATELRALVDRALDE